MTKARRAVGVTVATVVAMAVMSSPASGQGRPAGKWWQSAEVRGKLGLTAAQVAQIEVVQVTRRESLKSVLMQETRAVHDLLTTMGETAAPADEIASKRQALRDVWDRHFAVIMDYWSELRGVLTAEQWAMLPEVAPRALRLGGLTTRSMAGEVVER